MVDHGNNMRYQRDTKPPPYSNVSSICREKLGRAEYRENHQACPEPFQGLELDKRNRERCMPANIVINKQSGQVDDQSGELTSARGMSCSATHEPATVSDVERGCSSQDRRIL